MILRNLPDEAKHNIGYRNAWQLITGRTWQTVNRRQEKQQVAGTSPRRKVLNKYKGVISDSHRHLAGERANPDGLVKAMHRNNIDKVVIFVKARGGWTDDNTQDFQGRYPNRVITGVGFQNKGWRQLTHPFLREVTQKARAGRFGWLGEVSIRGQLGGRLHVPPDTKVLQELLGLSVEMGLPITIHHNPYEKEGEHWSRTHEFKELVDNLTREPKATVIWAHWCGFSSPQEIRILVRQLPNLRCDLAWIQKQAQNEFSAPLIDENHRFLTPWGKIIGEFHERFLVAVNNGAGPSQLEDYNRRIRIIRTALVALKPKVARKVATENSQRLISQGAK